MSVMTELKKVWKLLSESTNIPVLITASSIGTIGVGFLLPYLPVYLVGKGINFVQLGYIISIASFGSIVLKPLIGYISDRFGRKLIIVISFFLQGLLTPLYLFFNSVTGLAAVQLSRNTASEASQPALSAMIGDVAPKEGRATLFGFYSAIGSIVYAASLFGGGILLAWGLKIEHLFYIASGGLLVATAVLAFFLKETVKKEKKPEEIPSPEIRLPELPSPEARLEEPVGRLEKFFMSVIAMIADRNSLGLLFYTFFFMSALAVYGVYIPLFVTEVFHGAEEFVGPITAISWITFAVVQPFGGWLSDTLGKRKILIGVGLTLIIIFNTLMALSPNLAWMVVFWALIGVGDGMFRPVMSALVVDIVPQKKLGTFFGTVGSVRGVANVFAPLMYGFIAQFFSIRWTFQITSIFFILAMLTVLVLIKEGRVIGEKPDP